MTLLDNIGNSTIDHSAFGRLPDSRLIEYVSVDELLEIRRKNPYITWFAVTVGDVNEAGCEDLLDVLSTVHFVVRTSPVYVTNSVADFTLSIGIDSDIRSVKDAVKFCWMVSSAIWRSFGNIRLTVNVGWDGRTRGFIWRRIYFDDFLKSYRMFNADDDHNNLGVTERISSVLYHLIGRPVAMEEAERLRKWSRTYQRYVVSAHYGRSHK